MTVALVTLAGSHISLLSYKNVCICGMIFNSMDKCISYDMLVHYHSGYLRLMFILLAMCPLNIIMCNDLSCDDKSLCTRPIYTNVFVL